MIDTRVKRAAATSFLAPRNPAPDSVIDGFDRGYLVGSYITGMVPTGDINLINDVKERIAAYSFILGPRPVPDEFGYDLVDRATLAGVYATTDDITSAVSLSTAISVIETLSPTVNGLSTVNLGSGPEVMLMVLDQGSMGSSFVTTLAPPTTTPDVPEIPQLFIGIDLQTVEVSTDSEYVIQEDEIESTELPQPIITPTEDFPKNALGVKVLGRSGEGRASDRKLIRAAGITILEEEETAGSTMFFGYGDFVSTRKLRDMSSLPFIYFYIPKKTPLTSDAIRKLWPDKSELVTLRNLRH